MYYIQRKVGSDLETVDEFKGYREARLALAEYQLADRSARYYLSKRACKAWLASS